jgi:hypothetical protein
LIAESDEKLAKYKQQMIKMKDELKLKFKIPENAFSSIYSFDKPLE